MLWRSGPGMSSRVVFSISEIRAYSSVTNLLEGAALIEAPTPKHSDFSANNLIENQDTRSARQDINAITDWDGVTGGSRDVTRSTQSSCFVTTDTELAADSDQFVLTFDLMD